DAHDLAPGARAARARAPHHAAPRTRHVRRRAVDRLRHPPASTLRRRSLGQGRARRDAPAGDAVRGGGSTRRRGAAAGRSAARARARAAAAGRRASDEPPAVVPAVAARRRGDQGRSRADAVASSPRVQAGRRHHTRQRNRFRGASGPTRGARSGLPRRRAGVRVRARVLRRRRRAGRVRSSLHPGRPLPDHPRTPLRRSDVMRILVTIKQVPDTATQVKIAADGKTIDTTGITWIVSPYDEFAVEEALRIKEKRGQGEVVAVSLGPDRVKEALRSCLAMGCDRAIHLNDPAWAAADTLATARALAAVVKQEGPQLAIVGLQALPPRPPGRIIQGDVPTAVKELVRALREDAKAI